MDFPESFSWPVSNSQAYKQAGNSIVVEVLAQIISKLNNMKRKKQPEFEIQKAICDYLELQYPKVLFLSDTIASIKLTIPQQVRNKSIQKEGFKCPDLLILEPRGKYAGLFIEIKVVTPYKKER